MYLLEYTVCGVRYVGKFSLLALIPQAKFFSYFTGEVHHGLLKYIIVKIIDRLRGIGCGEPSGKVKVKVKVKLWFLVLSAGITEVVKR